MTRVLFLCSHNSARSQMAEAFLKHYASDRFEVFSAGLEMGVVNPYTIQVMEEIGIDMQGHSSKGLDQFLGKAHFGYLITVCDSADQRCPIFPGIGIRLHWSFEDPASFTGADSDKLAKFRLVRDQIDARIKEWLKEISTA